MSDKCDYPQCHARMETYLHRGGKIVQLCDLHLSALLSENRRQVIMTEKALKLPPIETGARMPSMEEGDIFCCAPGCNYPVSIFYGNKPVCAEHAKNHEYIPFDGVYRRRKILVIEKAKPPKDAVVMKGEGTGDEKREKKRKIYPVNPTRGIPLPKSEPELVLDGPPVASNEIRIVEERFVEALEQAPEEDIHDILTRLNSGELEMPED